MFRLVLHQNVWVLALQHQFSLSSEGPCNLVRMESLLVIMIAHHIASHHQPRPGLVEGCLRVAFGSLDNVALGVDLLVIAVVIGVEHCQQFHIV